MSSRKSSVTPLSPLILQFLIAMKCFCMLCVFPCSSIIGILMLPVIFFFIHGVKTFEIFEKMWMMINRASRCMMRFQHDGECVGVMMQQRKCGHFTNTANTTSEHFVQGTSRKTNQQGCSTIFPQLTATLRRQLSSFPVRTAGLLAHLKQ